jgi:hypothetical protein
LEQAQLLERAGREAGKETDLDVAQAALEEAGRLLEQLGARHAAARVAARGLPTSRSSRSSSRGSRTSRASVTYLMCNAMVSEAEGRHDDALPVAHRSFEIWRRLNQPHYEVLAYAEAIEAALALGEVERAVVLLQQLGAMPAVERRAFVDGHARRLAAKIAVQHGEDSGSAFADAAEIFRELSMPYWLAVTLTEAAEAPSATAVPRRARSSTGSAHVSGSTASDRSPQRPEREARAPGSVS